MRVHLPDCVDMGEELIAWVGAIAGVTSTSASSLTGNILVYFDPQQLSEQALLKELADFCVQSVRWAPQIRQSSVVAVEPCLRLVESSTDNDVVVENRPEYVTGLWRRIYIAAGWASVGMAVVGAIMPGIPTVPFVVLAAYFFVRSSPEAHAWLRQSRWFGSILRNWEEHRAVTVQVKYAAVGLILFAMVVTLVIGLPLWLLVTIYVFEILGLAIVLHLKVVSDAHDGSVLTVGDTPLLQAPQS
jgi:uncharacterized membrane protein YbaN (DUF454 family)